MATQKIELITLEQIKQFKKKLRRDPSSEKFYSCRLKDLLGFEDVILQKQNSRISGFRFRLYQMQDGEIWLLSEPGGCKFYEGPIDKKEWKPDQEYKFGRCFNANNDSGCVLSKRIRVYFPVKKPPIAGYALDLKRSLA